MRHLLGYPPRVSKIRQVRSLMINTDLSTQLRRARKIRLYRALVNSFWILPVLIILLNVLRLVPSVSRDLILMLWAPFGLLMIIFGIPWFVTGVAFMWGMVKCPRCAKRWVTVPLPYIPRRCAHCNFDVVKGGSDSTSNNRWSGP
jgi:hypothetical protein